MSKTRRPPVGIIDMGTNTFSLFVAERIGAHTQVHHSDSIAVRLGGGIEKGYIDEAAQGRAIAALQHFQNIALQYKAEPLLALATSAVRNANNKAAFLAAIASATGLAPSVLTGQEEANLIYRGVVANMPLPSKPSFIMDIGGGSVELILCDGEGAKQFFSIEAGIARMQAAFSPSDPILPQEVQTLEQWLAAQFAEALVALQAAGVRTLIGSSGSFDTLSAVGQMRQHPATCYSHITHVFDMDELYTTIDVLMSLDLQARIQVPGMAALRVDMIVLVCVLVRFFMKQLGVTEVIYCPFALKDGAFDAVLANEL